MVFITMETTNIYILTDPETNMVRYVGKANNITERYKAHLNKARKHQTHKKKWIASLRKKGLKPLISVIDVVPITDWVFWETYWISQFKTWGFNLINYTSGGDGCTFSNQTSFKYGDKCKKIVALNKNGVLVGEFNGINKGVEFCGKKCVDGALAGRIKTAGGYIWMYSDTYNQLTKDELKEIILTKNHRKINNSKTKFKKGETSKRKGVKGYRACGLKTAKKVTQLTLSNEFIKTFDCISDAASTFNCGQETIRRVCVGLNKTAKGYKWRYE